MGCRMLASRWWLAFVLIFGALVHVVWVWETGANLDLLPVPPWW